MKCGKLSLIILVCFLSYNGLHCLVLKDKKALYFFTKATEFFEKGDFKTAEKYYKEAAKSNPKMTEAYASIGLCRLFSGYVDWRKWIEKAKKLEPSNPYNYLLEGKGLLFLERYQEALVSFLKAYSLSRKDRRDSYLDEILYCIGYTYYELGDLEKSHNYASRLVNLPLAGNKWKGFGYQLLGYYYLKKGKPLKAIACFNVVQELFPDDPLICYQLGWAYLSITEVSPWWFIYSASLARGMFLRAKHLVREKKSIKYSTYFSTSSAEWTLKNLDYWSSRQIQWLSSALSFLMIIFGCFTILSLFWIVVLIVLLKKLKNSKKSSLSYSNNRKI